MRNLLLAGASTLALLLGGGEAAQATLLSFDYTTSGDTQVSAVQTYIVPTTGE